MWRLAILSLVLLPAGALAAKKAAKSAGRQKAPRGIWQPLVAKNTRWVLEPNPQTDPRTQVILESYDARDVGGARVARLRWSLVKSGAENGLGNDLPTQLAVTRKGAWFLTDTLDDEGVKKALKKAPTYADPPALRVRDTSYVKLKGDRVCIGRGGEHAYAEYCLAKDLGLVSVGGLYTPTAVEYTKQPPVDLATALKTGIPECDDMIGRFVKCVQEKLPDTAEETGRTMQGYTDGLKQMAREEAVNVCKQVAESLAQDMQAMGCTR